MPSWFEYRSCEKKDCEYNGYPHQHRTLIVGGAGTLADEHECSTRSTLMSVNSSTNETDRLQASSGSRKVSPPRRSSHNDGLHLRAFTDSFRLKRKHRSSPHVLSQGDGEYERLESLSTDSTETISARYESKSSKSSSSLIDHEDQLLKWYNSTVSSSAIDAVKPEAKGPSYRNTNRLDLYNGHLSEAGCETYEKARGIGTENQRISRRQTTHDLGDKPALHSLRSWESYGLPTKPQVLTTMQATTLANSPKTITRAISLANTSITPLQTQEGQTLSPPQEISPTPQSNNPAFKVTCAVPLSQGIIVEETIKCPGILIHSPVNSVSVEDVWQETSCPDTGDRLMFDEDTAKTQVNDTCCRHQKKAEKRDSKLWKQLITKRRADEQRYINDVTKKGVSVSTLPLLVKIKQNIARKEERAIFGTPIETTGAGESPTSASVETKGMKEKIKKAKTFFNDKKEVLRTRHSDKQMQRRVGNFVEGQFSKAFSLCCNDFSGEQDDTISPHSTTKPNVENDSESDVAMMTEALPAQHV